MILSEVFIMEEGKGCYGCLYFDQYDDGYGFCDYHEKWVKSSNSYGCGSYQTVDKENDK